VHRLGLFGAPDTSMQYTLNVLEWLHAERAFAALWGHYLQPAGFLAVLFGERAGLPCTVSARGNDLERTLFPPGDFARLLWTLERAGVVTAASRALKANIDLLLGTERAAVLYNAVDPVLFAPGPPDPGLRRSLGIDPREAVLGFSGELRLKKGLPFLLDALARVRRVRPACLLVIGEIRGRDTLLLDNFRAERPEDAARVIVTGHIPDPAEVAGRLRLCDLFLHPSLWDGLPNALLEAMACAIPVLASDAGGIPEALCGSAGGRLLARNELHRLGEAALELLDLPPAERAAMGTAGRRRALEAFHPGQEADALRAVLSSLGLALPA